MKLTDLRVYPIKATAAIRLRQAQVEMRGLSGDRRWLVCNEDGHFLQQRNHARLALVRTTMQPGGELLLEAPGMSPLWQAIPDGLARKSVTVWGDAVEAADAGDQAAAWFSDYLRSAARLVFMDEAAKRPVPAPHGVEGDLVSFADAMPVLLTTEASLADLNQGLEQPVDMDRFRPNLVVDGTSPWIEEKWKRLQIGNVVFSVTHPCKRCVVITVDQQTAEQDASSEPLRTLSKFRRSEDGVTFGINLIPRIPSTIRVGDPVTLLD